LNSSSPTSTGPWQSRSSGPGRESRLPRESEWGQKFQRAALASSAAALQNSHMWTVPACEGVECGSGEMVRCSPRLGGQRAASMTPVDSR
jgi:hypothetical protein